MENVIDFRNRKVIEKEFNVHYNTTYIWQILDKMGYSAQIPIMKAMEKNEDYVKQWLENEYPQYVGEARERGATILFQDESGMQSRPNVRRTWAQMGRRPPMKIREKWKDINITVEEGIHELSPINCITVHAGAVKYNQVPESTKLGSKLLTALSITLPKIIPGSGIQITTRKKLELKQKKQ